MVGLVFAILYVCMRVWFNVYVYVYVWDTKRQ